MVPVVVDPAFEQSFDVSKIYDSAQVVNFVSGDVEFDHIIVAVQVRTFAFVVEQSVASTKRDLSHDSNAHG